MDANAVLEAVEVVKEYPGNPPLRAVDGLSLRVSSGELVGIVGASGSGKSTLLHLLGALDKPTSGTVRVDGVDIGNLGDRDLSAVRGHRIGFVFQSFNLVEGLSASENVALGLMYQGVGKRARGERAVAALQRVGLADRAGHRPGQLSGGERQRVAIARAIVTEPAIVLADEPTGNLDTRNGEAILATFEALHAEGATIVVITHDMEIAAALPRQVRLVDGRVVEDSFATVR
jgi:putative ABC transport system ATP-binding protein